MFQTYEKLVMLIDSQVNKIPALRDLAKYFEEQTGFDRIFLIHGVSLLSIASLAVGYFGFVTHAIVYYWFPAYESLIALQSNNQKRQLFWFQYWIVLGAIMPIECYFDIVMGFVPFHEIFKLVFMIWCYAPIENNGSNIIIRNYILPLVRKFKNTHLNNMGTNAVDAITKEIENMQGNRKARHETVQIDK